MRFGIRESVLDRHAKALGCQREWPFVGHCVGCPFEEECSVPRAPLVLWTMRIDQQLGRAETNLYLNSITTSDISPIPRRLAQMGVTSYRTTAIQMGCGQILTSTDPQEDDFTLKPALNLHSFLDPTHKPCQKMVVMDSRQAYYNQISNYGRKLILAVQTCSKECAKGLTDAVNADWRRTTDYLRDIRPLKPRKKKQSAASPSLLRAPKVEVPALT